MNETALTCIRPPQRPSDADHKIVSDKWYEGCKGTLLDELPPEVMALSAPTTFIEIPKNLFDPLFSEDDQHILDGLVEEIDSVMGWREYFVKLNSRSAKDVWDGITCSGKHALKNFSASMRIMDDLLDFKWCDKATPKICIREVFDRIGGNETWEFRCFVKGGDLIAVSDYDYRDPNPYIDISAAQKIRVDIEKFFAKLHPLMEIQSYVFDVIITHSGMRLIEVNPYGLSDPCFFKTYDHVESARSYIQTVMCK